MKKILTICLIILATTAMGQNPKAKYIFYFIGDGMGSMHVELGGSDSLTFTQFPVHGTLTTHSSSDKITDSAAGGTALATGSKTSNGTIAMKEDHLTPLYSVAHDAHKAGLKVGIMTTVSIDHATPATFFAHAPKRSMSYLIASQLPTTGFELFAGSGFVQPKELFKTFADSSYAIVRGRKAELTGSKVIWIQDEGKSVGELPFAVDRKADDMMLPEMTERAIEFLAADTTKGFFMMIEGGLIDWAAHANNGTKVRGEVQDLSQAVAHAVEFYKAHPTQTLIIITADHETGGLSLNPVHFSSGDHTSTPVPIYAIGVGAEKFSGNKDNTSVARGVREVIFGTKDTKK
ncbi:MAG: alkaline phosphatase [Mucinivorans sp.]